MHWELLNDIITLYILSLFIYIDVTLFMRIVTQEKQPNLPNSLSRNLK